MIEELSIPRLVLAGAGSSVGKTSIAVGLLGALRAMGLKVISFKCGPDYLDPTYHTRVTGAPCHNLDGWMMGRQGVLNTFTRAAAGADIALVEGVMGLFDGASPTSDAGSTAEIAKWLAAPVVLAFDASGMSRTVAAVAHGFKHFDADLNLAGLIANQVGSGKHLDLLRAAKPCAPILGGIPKRDDMAFPHRHLGLRAAESSAVADRLLADWAQLARKWIDLEAILRLARSAPPLPSSLENVPNWRDFLLPSDAIRMEGACEQRNLPSAKADPTTLEGGSPNKAGAILNDLVQVSAGPCDIPLPVLRGRAGWGFSASHPESSRPKQHTAAPTQPSPGVPGEGEMRVIAQGYLASSDTAIAATSVRPRIGVARDDAFHFYYPENLRLLESCGAKLVFFSPIAGASLPEVDGLYLGGGYPEEHAAALSGNASMLAAIRELAAAGAPMYGECGGLMYLSDEIQTKSGQRHPMLGLIPGRCRMGDRLAALGYVEAQTQDRSILGPAGVSFRGHQFRYSQWLDAEEPTRRPDNLYCIRVNRTGAVMAEGYRVGSVLGSYVHAHWASNPAVAEGFASSCRQFAEARPCRTTCA